MRLSIFNSIGQRIRTLIDEHLFEGRYEVEWDATDDDGREVASGVYLYRLATSDQVANGRMTFIGGFGYAMSSLDKLLKSAGSDWDSIDGQLSPGPSDPAAFGFTGRTTPEQAAFAAGSAWIDLNTPARFGGSPLEVRKKSDRLKGGIELLNPSSEQANRMNELLAEVTRAATKERRVEEPLRMVRQSIQRLLAGRGAASTYFALGEWLQVLKASCYVARNLARPLAETLDISQNAATAGQLAEELEGDGDREELASALRILASLLVAEVTDVSEVLAQIDEVTLSVQTSSE